MTSVQPSQQENERSEGGCTVDGLALGEVAVVLAGEQGAAIAANDALDVTADSSGRHTGGRRRQISPVLDVVEEAFHDAC